MNASLVKLLATHFARQAVEKYSSAVITICQGEEGFSCLLKTLQLGIQAIKARQMQIQILNTMKIE